ncbi:MAG: FtsQ-type POTRA domain-containing protein [bacterium]|nr:FtsQ-type POTRA domain-containing protein [bacterium]
MARSRSHRKWRILRRSPRVSLAVGRGQLVIPFRPFSTVLIVLLALLSGYLFMRSDIFLIKNLGFEFEALADEALVRQRISEQVLARSIFLLDSGKVEEEIKRDFPTVKAVEFTRSLPDQLSIQVSVRVPLAIIEDAGGARFLVDSEGLLFREAADEKVPVIKLPEGSAGEIGGEVDGQGISGYLETLDLVSQKGLSAQGIFLHTSTIELRLKGTVAWLSSEGPIDSQIEILTQLLHRYKISGQTPKSVDLRFNRPVVRL